MLDSIIAYFNSHPSILGGAIVLLANWIIKVMPGLPHNSLMELVVGAVRSFLDAIFPAKPSA